MYDCVASSSGNELKQVYSLNDSGFERTRKIIRLAALLHDVGHAPFSHSGEDLMPLLPETHHRYVKGSAKKYEHEEYSIAIIKNVFKDIIENHNLNVNFKIKAEEITSLLGDRNASTDGFSLLWRPLLSSQLDADRADYLLRDSLHLGVSYGKYDRERLVNSLVLGYTETGALILAIEEKSWQVAESFVHARYQMFSQVYFHKVRRIYDYHIVAAVKEILKHKRNGKEEYPAPSELDEYLMYDDWEIYSAIKQGIAQEKGEVILNRKHFKCVYATKHAPTVEDESIFTELNEKYKDRFTYMDDTASTEWYKANDDIFVYGGTGLQPLSEKSVIVKAMTGKTVLQKRFYVSE